MSEVLVKYQPRVIEHFDIRIDTVGMLVLINTLKVAAAELDVDKSITGLIDALQAQYDTCIDGEQSTDAAQDGDNTATA